MVVSQNIEAWKITQDTEWILCIRYNSVFLV